MRNYTDVDDKIIAAATHTNEAIFNLTKRLIAARQEARANKQWGTADEIRQQLNDMGIILEDGPSGTKWRIG